MSNLYRGRKKRGWYYAVDWNTRAPAMIKQHCQKLKQRLREQRCYRKSHNNILRQLNTIDACVSHAWTFMFHITDAHFGMKHNFA